MPTSGTGSLWRIITAIAGTHYKVQKITEQMEVEGRGKEIPNWVPEPTGHLYMYNTPHFVNKNLHDRKIKLITNFRDPRDLACNQYYWALQHPIANRTEEYIDSFRKRVKENGIDAFVIHQDNTVLFRSLADLASRLETDEANVLKLSYAQLCLDFDNMLQRLVAFLGVPADGVPWQQLEKERTVNLSKNPQWIGQAWAGSDIMPGRYKTELKPETIAVINRKYKDYLTFLQTLEQPQLRALLTTEIEQTGTGEDRVDEGSAPPNSNGEV
jgi:hypothetical protein